ncbi:unnamed protein product [Arctogadus glacialis]
MSPTKNKQAYKSTHSVSRYGGMAYQLRRTPRHGPRVGHSLIRRGQRSGLKVSIAQENLHEEERRFICFLGRSHYLFEGLRSRIAPYFDAVVMQENVHTFNCNLC